MSWSLHAGASCALALALVLPGPRGDAAAQPAVEGSWSAPVAWPITASHLALLGDGRVLAWSDAGGTAQIWDPVSGGFTALADSLPPGAAIAQLEDGSVLAVGGRDAAGNGVADVRRFDPATNTWTPLLGLVQARDEAAAVQLGDGRVLVLGGEAQPTLAADFPEVAPPGSTWTQLSGAPFALPRRPWSFVGSDGGVAVIGPDRTTRLLALAGTGSWSAAGDMLLGARPGGNAVALPGVPDRYLILGGRDPATATCEVLDLGVSTAWQPAAFLGTARRHHQATLLPDGTVLVTGGTLAGDNVSLSVYAAERYDPVLDTWTTWASMAVSRRRGASALLLPDGRVLVAGGGDGSVGSELHPDAEIFSPPYLFQGARPVITAAPDSVEYGSSFVVDSPDAADVAAVMFVRAGACAAGWNGAQRALPLGFTASPTALTVSAPDSAGLAPPGNWMLFLLDDLGTPSVAAMVRLHAGTPVIAPPTITTTAPTTGQVGVTYVYAPAASGAPPITWSFTQAPAWLSVNGTNGIVAGTPDTSGVFAVTLRATNAGGFDEETWSLAVSPASGTPQVVVPIGATWRYFKGSADPGATWADLGYDDTSWLQGPSGFGYGDGDDATVLSDMRGNYTTVYTRHAFSVASAAGVSALAILYDYDDGFAVYLNGTRIFDQKAPSVITPASTATGGHEATGTLARADFTDAATLGLLVNGTNVLAAVGLNRSMSSSDLTLQVALELTQGGNPPSDAGDGGDGLETRFEPPRPNPFRGATTLAFRLARPGAARLVIYDVAGRRVRILERRLPAGPNLLRWDGRDAHGRTVAPGIYLYRLDAPGLSRHGKLARLRG